MAYRLVHDELLLDGVSRMNLATFCTTWTEPEVTHLLARSFDKNLVDKDEYPQTAELESRCVHMLADLWNAPDPASAVGTSTTGSSEAAMLGGLAAKWRWRKAREAAGKDTDRPNVNYLGGQLPTFNLNFSRPGGPVVAQYYTFLRLGRTGFAKVHEASYEAARHIAAEVAATGLFEPLFAGDPQHGIPAATWRALDATAGFSLFDLAEHLRTRGWLVPAYTLPPDRQDLAVQRVLARHGFSMDMADLLLDDLHHSLDALRRRPPPRPLRAEEVSTFDHDATPAKP